MIQAGDWRRGQFPALGLLALYDFRQDPANPQRLTDLSGNGRHGTLGSNATAADSSDPAWTAQGLQFDGGGDSVNLPAFPSLAGPHTVLAVHTPQVGGGAYPGVYSQDTGSNAGRLSLLYWNKTSFAYAAQRSVNGTYYTTANIPAAAGTPHLVLTTYDGAQLSLRVNGGAAQSKVAPATTATPTRTLLGSNDSMFGSMHLLLIWNRALRADEAQASSRAARFLLAQRDVLLSAG